MTLRPLDRRRQGRYKLRTLASGIAMPWLAVLALVFSLSRPALTR